MYKLVNQETIFKKYYVSKVKFSIGKELHLLKKCHQLVMIENKSNKV